MPIYEYVCLACEDRFEKLLPMGGADPACPSCGEQRVRRQPSTIALVGGAARATSASSGGCACGGACACRR